jgi:hypothetical protein
MYYCSTQESFIPVNLDGSYAVSFNKNISPCVLLESVNVMQTCHHYRHFHISVPLLTSCTTKHIFLFMLLPINDIDYLYKNKLSLVNPGDHVRESHRGWRDQGLVENWGLGEEQSLLTLIKV